MAQIKYITGPLKSGKTSVVIDEVVNVLKSGQTVAGILPSIEHINYVNKEILRRQPSLVPGQLFLGTFYAWSERILDSARQVFHTIQIAEEWLNIHDLLIKTTSTDDHFFNGYLQLLNKIFDDFRNSGLMSDELEKLGDTCGEVQIRKWIGLFNKLRHNYRQNATGPAGELLVLALELLQNQPTANWGEMLVIDGFYEFTPIQHKILKGLTAFHTRTICTSLTDPSHPVYDYCQNRPDLLGAGGTLTLSAKPTGVEWSEVIRTNLFREILIGDQSESRVQSDWQNAGGIPLKVVQCPTRRAEVETAARTIKCWLTEGMNPDKIGIVFRGSYDYGGLINLIFPGFGLPVSPTNPPLALSEPGQLLNRIIQVNLENFSRLLLLDLLRLPPIRRYYGADLLQEFEIHSAGWGLPTSKSDWISLCRRHFEYVQFILVTDSNENERERRNARLQIKRLQVIQPMLTKLVEDLSLPENTDWADFMHSLLKILERYYPKDRREKDQTDHKTIKPIKSLLYRLMRLRDGRAKTSLEELAGILPRFLETEINDAQTQTPGIQYDKLMDARGWEKDCLILLGLVEGEFPAVHPENPIFRNDIRMRLNQQSNQSLFAPTGFNLAEEKFLFYLMTSRAGQRLLITYPESDNGGRALPVSPFVTELLACQSANVSQNIISREMIPASRILPEPLTCGSEDDLLQNVLAENSTGRNFAKLAVLCDDKTLKLILIRLNNERGRLAGEGLRNGVLPNDRSYARFLSEPLSVTKIQNYVDCPFAYLCAHIWNIEIPGEPQIGLDAMTEGLLIHKTLEQFVKDFLSGKSRNWPDFLESANDDYINDLIHRLDSFFRPKLYFVPGLLWENTLSDLKVGLKRFIDTERRFSAMSFAPFQTEEQYYLQDEAWQFGNNPKIAITISGKIDRIDLNPNGDRFIVIDYKRSGSNITNIIEGAQSGRQFQIPLYLLMFWKENLSRQVGGAFYFSFKDGTRTRGFLVDTKFERTKTLTRSELDNLLAETRQRVAATLEQIYHGNFRLAPRNENRCQGNQCDFYDLCRVKASSLKI